VPPAIPVQLAEDAPRVEPGQQQSTEPTQDTSAAPQQSLTNPESAIGEER